MSALVTLPRLTRCAECGTSATRAVLVPWTHINGTRGETWEPTCAGHYPTDETWPSVSLATPRPALSVALVTLGANR